METNHIRQKDKNISGHLVPIRVAKTSPGLRQSTQKMRLVGKQRAGWIVRTGTLEHNEILNDIILSVGWHFVHIVMWMSLHMKPCFLSLTKTLWSNVHCVHSVSSLGALRRIHWLSSSWQVGSERIKSKTEKKGGLVGENAKEERAETEVCEWQWEEQSQDDKVINFR